jgi:hypothetical protein
MRKKLFFSILLMAVLFTSTITTFLKLRTSTHRQQYADYVTTTDPDVKRIKDLQTIALYLKKYYTDHGSYPNYADGTTIYSTGTQPWIPELRTYLFPVPVDPINSSIHTQADTFVYQYQSKQCSITPKRSCSGRDTQHFVLGAHLQNPHNPNINWNFEDYWSGWFINYVVTDQTPIPPTITITPSPEPMSNPPCVSTGVTKNSNGTYSFSWLHVAHGRIEDQANCAVTLQGFNTAGVEFGDGLGGGLTSYAMTQMKQNFNMNIWRLAINVTWWNNNNFVPFAHMSYQDWIKQIIAWMEASGNYIEIDPTTWITIPPSGTGSDYCFKEGQNPPVNQNCITSQNTANTPPWNEQQVMTAIMQFWLSFIPSYTNDPAILYDALNEPYTTPFINIYDDLNQSINMIQQLNPKALVFVYGHPLGEIVNGHLADYSQPNLVYTTHLYDDSTWPWSDKIQKLLPFITWVQQHNHAFSIEEWGGNLVNKKDYADAIMNLVNNQYVSTTYYSWAYDSFFDNTGHLTPNASILQQAYGGIH